MPLEINDSSREEKIMRLSISAIILTYNEEANIEDCIKSIYGWVDEIFIVDSYSTDKTLEIAKKYTDKIYQHAFENYAQQRNWAQDNLPINKEWVFHLDADERVSPGLRCELQKIFSSCIDVNGFIFPRTVIFRGKWLKHGWLYPVYHLRIFRKNKGRCEKRLYDQHYIVEGKVLMLESNLLCIVEPDLNLWREKHKRWANLEAQEILLNKNKFEDIRFVGTSIVRRRWLKEKVYYRLPLFIRPFIFFLWRYIIKLGFLDGKEGMIFHFWQGLWYRLLVDTKIYAIKKKAGVTKRPVEEIVKDLYSIEVEKWKKQT